ncbi:MAG: hypothetical protein JXR78_14300 [Victivallales bacterium]|nr:hypothetical protein [Victivallales bacterium]
MTKTLILICAVAMSLGVIGIDLLRQHGARFFAISTSESDSSISLARFARQWMECVKCGDMPRSLLLARRMSGNAHVNLPPLDYLRLFRAVRLSANALNSGFCDMDFLYWKDIAELEKIYNQIVSNPDNALQNIFAVVNHEVKEDNSQTPIATLIDVWNKRSASLNDKVRLIAGLARFAGYHTVLVFPVDERNRPVYMLMEFFRDGEFMTGDPRSGQFYPRYSVENIIVAPDLNVTVKQTLNHRKVYVLVAELCEYRACNQILFRKLKRVNTGFIAGDDPEKVIGDYMRLKGLRSISYAPYWNYPLAAAASHKNLPVLWKIPESDNPIK